MRFYYVVSLVTVCIALLASVDDAADITRVHDVLSPRMLRTDTTEDGEERAMTLPGNSKLAKWINARNKPKLLSSAEKRQVKGWLENNRDSKYVFDLLELNTNMGKALSNPKLKLYASYIEQFNKKNPSERVPMVEMFTKTYGDEVVAKALERAINAPKTERVAAMMRQDLLNKWEFSGEDAGDIFKLLKLDEAGYELFRSPQFNTWRMYTAMVYPTRNPDDVLNTVLTARYGADGLSKIFLYLEPKVELMRRIAMGLETQRSYQWLNSGKTPDDIFKLLKLNKGGADKLFTNPVFKTWEGYRSYFNLKKPDDATTAVQTLTNFYSIRALSDMLEAAKKVPNTEEIATKWLRELKMRGTQNHRITQ